MDTTPQTQITQPRRTLKLAPAAHAAAVKRLGLKPGPNKRARIRAAVEAIQRELAAAVPDVIAKPNHGAQHPLAIGIREDILALLPERDPRAIREFLRLYCRSPRYRALVAAGAPRMSLDGLATYTGRIAVEPRS